jgi:hypothetical protein
MKVATLSSRSKAFETALAVVQADIIADKLAGKLQPTVIEKPAIVEKVVSPRHEMTEFIDMTDETMTGQTGILDEDGEGMIEKVLLRSATSNFGIFVQADHHTPLQETWTDFQDVAAWQEQATGLYVMELTNIAFCKKIKLDVTTTGSVTFSRIFVKYTIKPKD